MSKKLIAACKSVGWHYAHYPNDAHQHHVDTGISFRKTNEPERVLIWVDGEKAIRADDGSGFPG